jgi:hypothetical protein
MYQRPTAPSSIGGVLDQGFKLFRTSFNEVFVLAFVAALAGQLPSQVLGINALDPDSQIPTLTAQASLVLVLSALIALVMFGAIVGRIHAVASSNTMSVSESLQLGLRRGPYLFAGLIIYVFAMALGVFLLFLPGIVVLILWSLSAYAIIIKNMGPIAAISYSQKLVWRNFIRATGLLLLTFLGLIALYVFAAAIVGLMVNFDANNDQAAVIPWYINLLVLPLVGAVGSPFLYAMSLSILYDFELRDADTD